MFYYTNSLGESENPNFPLFLDKKSPFYGLIIGARYRIRTYDPCNVNAVLYHWANRA